MSDFLSKARHYHESAQGLRSLAEHDTDLDAKERFLSLAESYDGLSLFMLQCHTDQCTKNDNLRSRGMLARRVMEGVKRVAHFWRPVSRK